MKSTAGWILITLVLIAAIAALMLTFGWAAGICAGLLLTAAFLLGLDQLYRSRSRQLARSMRPGETLVASGIVSEEFFDETPAVLVRDSGNRYRLLVADCRDEATVQSVTPVLRRHANPADRKCYIEVQTIEGRMHFAPRKGFLVAQQLEYAQRILEAIRATAAVPPSPLGES
jgi:uncharacterized protein (DUF58 family)